MNEFLPVIVAAALALLFAGFLYLKNAAIKVQDARMAEIAGYISEGAMAYLKRQYTVLAIFSVVMFVILIITPGLGLDTAICLSLIHS